MSFTTIAFRNIPKRKLRNALTVIAVILGVALVVGVNIAFDSVYNQFTETLGQAMGNVDINIRSGQNKPFDQDVLATVREIDNVVEASPRITSTEHVSLLEEWEEVDIIGVDSASDFDYLDSASTNITGTKDLGVNSTEVVASAGLNCIIGETLKVNVTIFSNLVYEYTVYNFTVVGVYHPNPIVENYIGERIYIDITKAQTIYDYGSKIESIIVKVVDIKETNRVVKQINSQLGAEYVVSAPKLGLINTVDQATQGLKSGLQIMSVMALCVAIVIVLNTVYMNVGERTYDIGILRSQGASTGQIFWMFFSESLILGLVGAAIGLFAGIALTNVFSYITSRVFTSFTGEFTVKMSLDPSVFPHLVLGASAGLLTTVIGGLFPSFTACRIDVIKALRPSMRKAGKQRTALKLIAVGLPLSIFGAFMYIWFDIFTQLAGFGLGLIMVGLLTPIPMIGVVLVIAGFLRRASPVIERALIAIGKTRKVISRNVERNLLRSTICFALIGISLSLVIVISGAQAGVVMGVEDVIRSFSSSDLTVVSETLISTSFAENLTEIDDGALIECTAPTLIIPVPSITLRNSISPSMNSSSTIMTIDPATYSEAMSMTFTDDTPSNVFTKLEKSGTIIITAPLAQSLNTSLNEVVTMRYIWGMTPFGVPIYNETDFTVVGIAQGAWLELMSFGNLPLTETGYISYNSLNDTFPSFDDKAALFFVKAKAGQDVNHIRDRIEETYDDEYDLTVSTYEDAVERVRSAIDEMFYIFYSIIIFAVVNSAIGVAAIIVMNVAERRRELGIMRAQGLSKGEVVILIVGEVMVLGVVGFFLSTITGLMLHRITVSFMELAGFAMPFIIPFEAVGLSLLLAVATSVLSAVVPAFRASQLDIVESLRH